MYRSSTVCRSKVYEILMNNGIRVPRYAVLRRPNGTLDLHSVCVYGGVSKTTGGVVHIMDYTNHCMWWF